MQHARLSPSSASRWLTCTASVKMAERYENTSNEHADWGTLAHEVGECLLLNKPLPKCDKENLTCAEEYADYVRSLVTKDSILIVEETFDLGFISPNQFGTCDACVLNGSHLHIIDLKTGHNIVKAENNSQLMLYALGAVHDLSTLFEIDTVTLHIVQTRAEHIDVWETTVGELNVFKKFVIEQANKIVNDKVEFNPEAKACKYCPHQVNCEALKSHVENVVKGSFENLEDIDGKADLIDSKHIKKILDNEELILTFVKTVKEVALERMQKGDVIEGYKVVESNTNRKWADEEKMVEYVKQNYDGVELFTQKLLPMTQILKLFPKDEKLKEMLIKPDGQPTLAPLSDKRPSLISVKDMFDKC